MNAFHAQHHSYNIVSEGGAGKSSVYFKSQAYVVRVCKVHALCICPYSEKLLDRKSSLYRSNECAAGLCDSMEPWCACVARGCLLPCSFF